MIDALKLAKIVKEHRDWKPKRIAAEMQCATQTVRNYLKELNLTDENKKNLVKALVSKEVTALAFKEVQLQIKSHKELQKLLEMNLNDTYLVLSQIKERLDGKTKVTKDQVNFLLNLQDALDKRIDSYMRFEKFVQESYSRIALIEAIGAFYPLLPYEYRVKWQNVLRERGLPHLQIEFLRRDEQQNSGGGQVFGGVNDAGGDSQKPAAGDAEKPADNNTAANGEDMAGKGLLERPQPPTD